MRYLRLLARFAGASLQEEVAHRSNFAIAALHAVLNLATGLLGLLILFGQVQEMRGWDFPAALALLGVYLTLGALRNLVVGPSLDSLAGMEGDVWSGRLDFTLLRPVDVQFLATFRRWQPLALLDLALGLGVLAVAANLLRAALTPAALLAFLATLAAALLILYALLLAMTALIFWAPGVLFTWIFEAFLQMARYPLGLYPGWVRLLLTWVIPVGVITTVPAQALSGALTARGFYTTLLLAALLLPAASRLFHLGLRRYESASS